MLSNINVSFQISCILSLKMIINISWIIGSKHSAPFRKPMDKRTNKKYYDLVKEPMGKSIITERYSNPIPYTLLLHSLSTEPQILLYYV